MIDRFEIGRERDSTIGEGGDTTILSPGRSPKQPLAGIGLHDLLHGRQACPELTAFDQGFGQYVPGRGYFRVVSSQNGDKFVTSPPASIVERVGTLACKVAHSLSSYLPGMYGHHIIILVSGTIITTAV